MLDHALNIVIRTLPSSGERPPLFIIGDVHGCAHELSLLVKKAREKIPNCQIVLVGDLFTKGPDPVGVFDIIQEYGALCIKGNHDWALIASLLHAQKKGAESLPEHTQQTLHLIRYHRKAILSFLMSLPHAYTSVVVPQGKHKDWESSYAMNIVHAGIDPVKGLTQTSERMLLTARWVRWEGSGDNRHLVLVHSSSRMEMSIPPTAASGRGLSHSHALPPNRFRWHELFKGPELIVFGHDAKQGLFRKTLENGRPICVGLDTGCTYGRSLTGYFPEFDDALQVEASRIYFDIRKNLILLRRPLPVEKAASGI